MSLASLTASSLKNIPPSITPTSARDDDAEGDVATDPTTPRPPAAAARATVTTATAPHDFHRMATPCRLERVAVDGAEVYRAAAPPHRNPTRHRRPVATRRDTT